MRLWSLFFCIIGLLSARENAVTYSFSGGRFGDCLLSYLHAKWIAYKYNIPLLYKPFPHSDELFLHVKEIPYSRTLEKRYAHKVVLGKNVIMDDMKNTSTLFVVPYFPESRIEMAMRNYYSFPVDWEDPGFKAIIRSSIKPRRAFVSFVLPEDRIHVAVHVREGGGIDLDHTRNTSPWKLPKIDFYIEQIRRLSHILGDVPMYVYIFTDCLEPSRIMKPMETALKDLNIRWGYRAHDNGPKTHVVQDLMGMICFDYLIRPDSNYSIVAEKLGDFKIVISPAHIRESPDKIFYIDEVHFAYKK